MKPRYVRAVLWVVILLAACRPSGTLETERPLTLCPPLTPSRPPLTGIPSPNPTLRATTKPTATPPARSTQIPFRGWVVFSSQREDTNMNGVIDSQDGIHLYVMDLATRENKQITFGDYTDLYPSWSPDHTRITFSSNRGNSGNLDLFIVGANGENLERLTETSEADETQPDWSPDGQWIAYSRRTSSPQGELNRSIFLASATGGDPRQLTEGPHDEWPDWSPDGRYLAFQHVDPPLEGTATRREWIYLWDTQTEEVVRLDLPGESAEDGLVGYIFPRWLPQDDYLLSVIQVPMERDTGVYPALLIFRLREGDGGLETQEILPVINVGGFTTPVEWRYLNYTWGTEGDWLIGVMRHPPGETYDLVWVEIALVESGKQDYPSPSTLEEERLITADKFYDDFPDWAP